MKYSLLIGYLNLTQAFVCYDLTNQWRVFHYKTCQVIYSVLICFLHLYTRCGRVMADNIAYAKFRKTLLKDVKPFFDVCNTNHVLGLRRF